MPIPLQVEFVQSDLGVSGLTATKYLDTQARDGERDKRRIGCTDHCINQPLYAALSGNA